MTASNAYGDLAASRPLYQHPKGTGTRLSDGLAAEVGNVAGDEVATITAMIASVDLDSAVGVQLDRIGALLRFARVDLDDATYRLALRVAVQYVLSSGRLDGNWAGTCESVIAIARTLAPSAGTITLTNVYPYAFSLDVPGASASEIATIMRLICRSLWAGVYGLASFGGDGTVWGSESVAVPASAPWGSESVAVTDPLIWGDVAIAGTGGDC